MLGVTKMAGEEGVVNAFYSGFGPILAKQVQYTMAKFAVRASRRRSSESIGKTPKTCVRERVLLMSACRRSDLRHLAPGGCPPVQDQQGWRRRPRAVCSRASATSRRRPLEAVHAGLREVRDDRYASAGQFSIFDIVMNAVGVKFPTVPPSPTTQGGAVISSCKRSSSIAFSAGACYYK